MKEFIINNKKKLLIIVLILLVLIVVLFQLKVTKLTIDVNYSKSSYITMYMSAVEDDTLLATPNSKVYLIHNAEPKRLFNKFVKWSVSDKSIAEVKGQELVIHSIGEIKLYAKSIFGVKSNTIKLKIMEKE